MLKKFGFLVVIIVILSFLSTNVSCWSNRNRERSKNAEDAIKNTRSRQKRKSNNIQEEVRKNREKRLKEDAELRKINENLQNTQIPSDDQADLDEQIKNIDEQIQQEEDEQQKQEQLKKRQERLEEIRKNTDKIKQQRQELERQKQQREEELSRKIEEEIKQEQQDQQQNSQQESDPEELTAEQIEENMKKGQDSVRDEDMSKWLEDWEKHMKDFKADEMLSFEVPSRGFEVFFEEIESPCQLRGAYFINFDAKEAMDLKILDPKNKEVHKNIGQRQGIFSFNATEIGTYSFYFQNRRSSEKKVVSFVVDISDNESHLQSKDIDIVQSTADEVWKSLKSQLYEYKTLRRKDNTMEKQRKSNARKIFWFSIAETIVIIGCTIFQVMYIKKILDNRSFV